MVTAALVTVTIRSRSCGQDGPPGVGAGGMMKCRTWTRLRHTGQSVASWPGTRRSFALSRDRVSSRADAGAVGGWLSRAAAHA